MLAIAIACCLKDEGPLLIVCPALLRYTWAEELERWDPSFLPKDIHLGADSEFHYSRVNFTDVKPGIIIISYL